MSITLSASDVESVVRCSQVLLSLIDGGPIAAWAERVIGVAKPLIGADRMALALPDPHGFVVLHSDGAHDAYIYDSVSPRGEWHGLGFWNQWVLANKLVNPAGVSRDVPGCAVPASLIGYKQTGSETQFGDRELTILRLLQPSFDAAITAFARFSQAGIELASHIDRLPVPALLVGSESCLHANAAFVRAMGRHVESVMTAVTSAAQRALRQSNSGLEPTVAGAVTGPDGNVQWSVCMLSCAGRAPLALVHFDTAPRYTIDETKREQLGLSYRQAEVAELMAEGLRHRDIAHRLEIQPNTARRHCEHVLQRLGIHSRVEVRRALLRSSSPK